MQWSIAVCVKKMLPNNVIKPNEVIKMNVARKEFD